MNDQHITERKKNHLFCTFDKTLNLIYADKINTYKLMKWSFKGFKALGQFIFNIDLIVPFRPILCLFFRVELLDIRGFFKY